MNPSDVLFLIIMVFGHESMRAGPFYSMHACHTVEKFRSAELDRNYSRLPVGTGMELITKDARGNITSTRTVMRSDITMECRFDGAPQLRGPLG